MKKSLSIFLFASSLVAQVQIGKNVQIGAGATSVSTTLQTNGANNASQTTLNFVNPAAYNGLTFTFSNPTLGNETFTIGGTLGNAGLTNPSTTVNGQTCTLGSTCTISTGGSSVGTAGQLQMVGSTAGSFAASHATDNGTTFSVSEPATFNDGTGKAGAIQLLQGTAPSAAAANTVQINAPTAVTAYSVTLPGTQGTGALTNNGSGTLTWATPSACTTCVTSAASLTNNAVMIGGGSQASSTISADTTTTHALFATAGAPAFRAIVAGDIPTLNQSTTGNAATATALSTAGTTTTVLHGNAAGAPSYSAVSLTADVTGLLPNANLANPATTVNGTTCTLGSTCTIAASGGGIPYVATTGAVNVMVATFSPAITSLTTGLVVEVLANLANTTTSPTLNVNGLGAKNIFKMWSSNGVSVGDFKTTIPSILIYDGTQWQLLNPQIQSLLPNGSVGVPSYSFASAPDYGFYYDGSGNVHFSRGGLDILHFGIGGLTVDGGGQTIISVGSITGAHLADTTLTTGGCIQYGASNLTTPSTAGPCPQLAATQTSVNCSTSGNVIFSQPMQGTSYKQVMIWANACSGTASYTYPTAFSHAPQVLSQSLAAIAGTPSTTAVTITGLPSTGFLELDGF